MKSIKVLLIESNRNNTIPFAASLKRKYQLQIASSGRQGLLLAQTRRPDVIIIDTMSLRTSGKRICSRLRAEFSDVPIILIRPASLSPSPGEVNAVLSPPFTVRKLSNLIGRFTAVVAVKEEVKETEKVLVAGPFSLDLEQHTLVTPWWEKKLTPKLVLLMELFMRNPEKALERREIMQKVWETDYVVDTRTLDVHIRWLRKVIEPDPRQPHYLTTVRGTGYCLTLPPANGKTPEMPSEPEE